MALIEVQNLSKIYRNCENLTYALKNIHMSVEQGEMVAITGPSGSGKSSLLNILGCLDVQSEGKYTLNSVSPQQLSRSQLAQLRNREIGFIFQHNILLSTYNVLENVQLPLQYRKIRKSDRKEMALNVIKLVGMESQAKKYPHQLSGGQQQRVAIARALVGTPSIILADEPTGALDQNTGRHVLGLLKNLVDAGSTIIIVTHDHEVSSQCNRIVKIVDGEIVANI
ncbi:peptide ABC transporter ATP-binding protein [Paenibacillus ferrarius]|uniref:Peptide ABC transporter ATP-binding protein n=1 Tax=Paenibacillus ferrarius TaxID=1469647 RepID=A0A1V4HET0_9BACL|nr:ABC transporter ATP-binding protein [Paenibacillus ferrarius]OPH53328.1 peptide ABC transporter ATP-binding protein [Paenibacillus ferrarius]